MFDQNTLSQLHTNYLATKPQAQPKQPPKKKGNFLTSLIPSGGGIAGAAGGAALGSAILPGVGTLAGALLGGAFGGGAGKVAENAIEHNRLSSGVAGEAAINGVLGAGPLRLAKVGVDAVRGVRAGAGLADALAGAGNSAASMSVTKSVGDKLAKSGQKLIAKEFRLNPTQQANFAKLHGEEATSVLRRYGVKAPEDIQARIQPLQDSFDSVVSSIPAIGKPELAAGLQKVYQPLLKSPALFEQGLGGQIKQQANELLKLANKGALPADKVNELRKTFDAAVNYTQKGAPEYNVIKKTADALRGTLQTAADKAGVKTPEGLSFKDVGKELRKLYGLDDVVGKQAYLGTGSLPLSLGNTPGTVIGSAGGPLGAAAGYVGNAVVNSPMGRRVTANGAIKLGEKLAAKGENTVPYSLMSTSKRIAPVGLAGALMGQLPSNSSAQIPTTTTTSTNMPSMANMPELSQTDANMSTGNDPMAPENLQASIKQILASGGTLKDASDFVSLATALQKVQATTAPTAGYSKPTASQYAQGISGQQSIQQLQQLLQQDPSLISKNAIPGQGQGVLGSLLSGALGTSDYKAVTHNILNSIARINTGANMPVEEEQFYRKTYLPQPGDSDKTKQDKINALQTFFNPITNYGGGQPDATDLASALGI